MRTIVKWILVALIFAPLTLPAAGYAMDLQNRNALGNPVNPPPTQVVRTMDQFMQAVFRLPAPRGMIADNIINLSQQWADALARATDLARAQADAPSGAWPEDFQWKQFRWMLFYFGFLVAAIGVILAFVVDHLPSISIGLPSFQIFGREAAEEGQRRQLTFGQGLLRAGEIGLALLIILAVGGRAFAGWRLPGGPFPWWQRLFYTTAPCPMGTVPQFEVKTMELVDFEERVGQLRESVRTARSCLGSGMLLDQPSQRAMLEALDELEATIEVSPDVRAALAGGPVNGWSEIQVWIAAYAQPVAWPVTSGEFRANSLIYEGWFRQAEQIYWANSAGTISGGELARAQDLAARAFSRAKALSDAAVGRTLPFDPDAEDVQRLNLTVVNAGRLLLALQASR